MRRPRLWVLPFVAVLLVVLLLTGSAILLLGGAVAAEAAGLDGWAALDADAWDWRLTLAVIAGSSALMIAVVAGWWRWAERRPAASVGLPRRRLGRAEAVWSLVGVGWALVATVTLTAFEGDVGAGWDALLALAASPAAALAALSILLPAAVLAAAAEEVVFRGWLLTAISARAGLATAVAVSSGLFAAAHFEPAQLQAVGRVISVAAYVAAGAGMAVIALKRGDLYAATAFHAGFNVVLLLLEFGGSDLDPSHVSEQVLLGPRGTETVSAALAWLGLELALLVTLIVTPFGSRRLRPTA